MKCPNCSNKMKLNAQLKFNVYKCPVCELYTSEAEFNYSFESNVQLGKRELGIENLRKDNFKLIIENLKNVAESDMHNFQGLEIGSGNGWWLETCKKNNITCIGIEPERVYESFHKKSELDIIYDFYPSDQIKDLKFDFIIFNDVFEHISDKIGRAHV